MLDALYKAITEFSVLTDEQLEGIKTQDTKELREQLNRIKTNSIYAYQQQSLNGLLRESKALAKIAEKINDANRSAKTHT